MLRDSYRGDAFAAEDSLGEHRLNRLGEAGQVADATAKDEDVRVEDVDDDGQRIGESIVKECEGFDRVVVTACGGLRDVGDPHRLP